MKPTLMIHDFKREYLDLPLEDYKLTFDDGLVSPLSYWHKINKLKTQKIFFIPTLAIGNGIEGKPVEQFMNLEQIKFLDSHGDVTIGGHSHAHRRLDTHNSFIEAVDFIGDDTKEMCEWFKENLGYSPAHFCFPYNESNGIYEAILRQQYHIPFIYGAERIDIEDLL